MAGRKKKEPDTRNTYEVEFEHERAPGEILVRKILVLGDDEEEARQGSRYWKKGYEWVGKVRLVTKGGA